MILMNASRALSLKRSPIYQRVLFALATGVSLVLISTCPFQSYRTSAASERISETTPIPSATPEVFTIEPSQMARGTNRTIEINIKDCPNKKFGDANKVFAEGDLNTLKGKGIEITGGQTLGECKFSAELKVADSALYGPVAITFHYLEGDKDQTKTLIIRVVTEEPTPPGPLVPGLDPQVDVMWSVVPQGVVKDNFGIRVGKLFYCLEVVIGNSTGYDLQIAAVGFQLGPTGKHAETVVKTSRQAAEIMQTSQDASLEVAFSNIPGECRTESKDNPTAYLDCVSRRTKEEIEKVTASQARVVAALQNQRDVLATLPPNDPNAKLPASSYRMTRGSIEHGQFWNLRDTSIRLVKALGPVLTGFTPYFHNISHQRNYAEAINIFSNPFEKGIELVFPDETIQQLQRLDEQTLRDGMIIQNNRQIRTRTFIPKDVLNLEKPYRDDPMVVMMALGKLHIIGDLIEYKNRISVTSNPSGAVIPPPTVSQTNFILTLGTTTTFNISGTFLDGARLEGDDPVNIHVGSTSSTEKTASAPVTIDPTATVGEHTFRLITKGGLASIPVTLTQPKPEVDPAIKTKFGPSDPTINTPDKVYTFEVTGKFFQTAKLSVPEGSKNAISLVSTEPDVSEGGTKLIGKFKVLEGATPKAYTINITNDQNKNAPTPVTVTVGDQPPPAVKKDADVTQTSVPPAFAKSDGVTLIVKGENLFNAMLDTGSNDKDKGITINIVDNKKVDTLTAKIFVNEKTPEKAYDLELRNANTADNAVAKVKFKVGPQADVAIIKVAPEEIEATGKEQTVNIVFTGANLRQIEATVESPLQNIPKESIHESNGETLTIDVKLPATLKAGDKVMMTLKNSNKKEVKREIKVVPPKAPPAPTITKFQKAGVDVESGQVGETIVIIGENLKGTATEVKFGTVTATATPENIQAGKITVIIPSGLTPSPEGIDVTVTTTPGGTGKKKFIIIAP